MMAINMSYTTNFTTDKPVVCETSSACTFGSDQNMSIATLVASYLQFFTTVAGLWWVNRVIKNKDEKREYARLEKEEREKKERLEVEERDKIADIINNEYDKIFQGGIDVNLKKCKEEFEDMVMFYGTVSKTGERKDKITGLEVLKFMLLNPNDFKGEPLKKLQEDLEAVQKLFRTLRLKLPLKGDCPINIKEELGPLITGIGEIIARFFVSAKKRYTISNVLKYFGNVREVRSIENEEKEDDDNNRKIRRILPYVNYYYYNGGFIFDTLSIRFRNPQQEHDYGIANYDLWSIIQYGLSEKNIEADRLRELADEIKVIWRRNFEQRQRDIPMPDWSENKYLSANIIHAVRVFWFMDVTEGNINIIQTEEFKNLVKKMKDIRAAQSSDTLKEISETKIVDIRRAMDRLMENQGLCKQESIANMLTEVSKNIDEIIAQYAQERDSGLQPAGMLVGNLQTYV